MINNYVSIIFIVILASLLFPEKGIEINTNYYLDNFLENTSKLEVYNNNITDIFLNNESSSKYYLNITDLPNFSNIIQESEYNITLNYKLDRRNSDSGIVYLLMFIGFIYMFKYFSNNNPKYNMIYKKNKKSKIALDDIAGLEYAKQEVFEFIDFLQNREKYIEAGAKMPRGALFYGPPGTGKTMLAKAIAGEANVNFISASGSDFVEVYVGVGASRVRQLFQKARKNAPCVIFIDEIDSLARKRSNGGSGGNLERDSTLNTLLVELDGFEENQEILIIGATNRLELLDDAVLRPGRFDRKIRFDLPERQDREQLFFHSLESMNLDDSQTIEDTAYNLSKLSFGFSAADIANICNEACILSVRKDLDTIDQELLEEAVDNVLLGPEKKTFRLSDKERNTVAFHEAGHTVVAYLSEHSTDPIKVSIMPRGKSALGFSQREMPENKLMTKDEFLDDMCVLLGGRVAEEIFCGQITTGASDDIQKLTERAYQYVSFYGMDPEFNTFYYNLEQNNRYSNDLRKDIDTTVQDLINSCYQRTTEILNNNENFVRKIKEELIENDTLNKEDLINIFSEGQGESRVAFV